MRPKLHATKTTTISANQVTGVTHGRIGGAYFGKNRGVVIAGLAVVVNVTVAVAVVDPLRVTDDGETVHVAACGAPMQSHVTVCFEPFSGAADTVKLACCPAVMVVVDGVAETL
jgi:hypothetical protein